MRPTSAEHHELVAPEQHALLAVAARATIGALPRRTDAIASLELLYARVDRHDVADDFVTRNERELDRTKLASMQTTVTARRSQDYTDTESPAHAHVPQTPQASTLTTTSPCSGSFHGRSVLVRGVLAASHWYAVYDFGGWNEDMVGVLWIWCTGSSSYYTGTSGWVGEQIGPQEHRRSRRLIDAISSARHVG